MLSVVFAHSVVVSKSLYHTTLHSTQSTSLASSLIIFSKGPQKALLFLLKASIVIAIVCFTLLTAVQVAIDIAPKVFEAVHLLIGFISNSHVYLLWFSSDNHGLRLTDIYLYPIGNSN